MSATVAPKSASNLIGGRTSPPVGDSWFEKRRPADFDVPESESDELVEV